MYHLLMLRTLTNTLARNSKSEKENNIFLMEKMLEKVWQSKQRITYNETELREEEKMEQYSSS